MTRVLERAAALQRMEGQLLEGVVFAATRFSAIVQVDTQEHERRHQVRLASVGSAELLEVLARLPHGLAVPWSAIDPIEAAVLDVAPPGVIEASPTHMRRLWRPAVAVTGVLVIDEQAARGLDAASLFAPDARRCLVAHTDRGLSQKLVDEAKELGVGVVRATGQDCEVIAHAPATVPARVSARHWRFLETVYDRWLLTEGHISAQASR